jgi:23S rRNA (uracil1939-C5)-methyltransferase
VRRVRDVAQSEGPEGSVVTLRAIKLIGGGRALAHHENETWMVAGALPGEEVEAQTTRRRAGIVEARTLEVLGGRHPARMNDPCPQTGICGGCDWPHVDPIDGGALKAAAASDAARTYPDLAALIADAPIHTSPPGYRLRARLHWDPELQRLGFFEARSRNVAAIDGCQILSPQLSKALPVLCESLGRRCPVPVDVEWLEGTDPSNAVAALRRSKGGPRKFNSSWVPVRQEVGSVMAGFHALSSDGLPGHGWGPSEVRFDLPIPLTVPIGCFFQGNRHLLTTLFDRVAELAGDHRDPVFDLHAGVGLLAAAARSAGERELNLVEPHRPAARAAQGNLPDARVAVGETAESFVGTATTLPRRALVITDPPRTGMSRGLLRDLARWAPRRILMLGCDPATWARDAGFLAEHGYRPTEIELFDLFPHTHHVEILALMEHTRPR